MSHRKILTLFLVVLLASGLVASTAARLSVTVVHACDPSTCPATETAAAQQTAAQQTADAAATQTAAAQQTANVTPTPTTGPDLTQTAQAGETQTASAATQQAAATETSVAETLVAGIPGAATRAAQFSATAAAQQSATAAAQQSATAAAQETATMSAQQATQAAVELTSIAEQSTATALARRSPTPSSPPPPPATNTPPPTATSQAAPSAPQPTVASHQPTPQASPTAAGLAHLSATLAPPLVRPGDKATLTIVGQPQAFIDVAIAFPGIAPLRLMAMTDSHGRVTFTIVVTGHARLSKGRATVHVTVSAYSGAWQRLGTLSPALHAGAVAHIVVTTSPQTYFHANVSFSNRATTTLYGLTDAKGRATLSVTVPAKAQAAGPTHITVYRLAGAQRQQVSTTLNLSDMLVNLTSGTLTNCIQTQTVHVRYLGNVPLQILLMLPNNTHLPFTSRTDGHGDASIPVTLKFTRAASPVRIAVQARDARPHVSRAEQISVNVPLPKACSAP